jgi:predicted TPR repeat methyltransferase
MSTNLRLLRNPLVALAPAEDGYLAYDASHDRLHRLNAAAALIIELCDGTRTAAAILADVAPFVAGDAGAGCARWIDGALEDGLLKTIEPDASGAAPPPPEYFSKLASRLRSKGSVRAAFVCQHYATMQTPDDAEQWAALGDIAHIVGRREDAREAYERYLELSPGDAEVEHILVALRDAPPPPRAPDECVVQLYERFAEFYERNMRGDLEYCGPELIAAALDRTFGSPDAALDVLELGCGTGLVGKPLRARARRLVGIDLSPDMVKRAKATKRYDALEVAEITEWLSRSLDREFDLIAAGDTFIYFGDLRQILKPAAARLRTGGRVVFTVERDEGSGFRLTDSGRYVHSDAHIHDAARDAGLVVEIMDSAVLRYEYGEAVQALVVVLRAA